MAKPEYRIIGKSTPFIDARDKATGTTVYTSDITLPNMLYGKVVRSTVAHGRILSIDTSAAERLPGVKAVITAKDTVAILLRYVFVYCLAKYELCNPHGETVLAGYRRLGAWAPIYMIIAIVIVLQLIGTFLIKGAVENLTFLIPALANIPAIILGLITSFCVIYLALKPLKVLETVFKIFLAIMTVIFVYGMIAAKPDLGAIAAGAVIPRIPEGGLVIAVSLIGTVGCAPANLIYSYLIREKGWQGKEDLRQVKFDLGFPMIFMFILILSVWVVAAAYLKPNGIEVNSSEDIAKGFAALIGPIGAVLFHVGLFVAIFTTLNGLCMGYARMVSDIVKQFKPLKPITVMGQTRDWVFFAVVAWGCVVPLVWLFTSAGFVQLTVMFLTANVFVMPLISIGALIMVNKKAWIGEGNTANWWQNAGLGISVLLGIFFSVQGLINLL